MSKVHFIDTTVLAELLNIPGLSTQHEKIKAEYLQLDHNEDIFVLPVATLVETGNHIAHIPDGNLRYGITAVNLRGVCQNAHKSGTIIVQLAN